MVKSKKSTKSLHPTPYEHMSRLKRFKFLCVFDVVKKFGENVYPLVVDDADKVSLLNTNNLHIEG